MVSWTLSDSAMRSRSTCADAAALAPAAQGEQQHQHEPRAGLESHGHIPRPGAPSRRARYSYSNLRRSSAPGSSGTWRSHCSTAWSCSPLPASAPLRRGPSASAPRHRPLRRRSPFAGTGLRLFLLVGRRGLLPGRIGLRFAVGAGFVALSVPRWRGLGWLVAVVPWRPAAIAARPSAGDCPSCCGLASCCPPRVLRLLSVLLLLVLALLLLALLQRLVHQLAVRGGVAHAGLARQRRVVGRERLLEPPGARQRVAAVVVRVGVVPRGPGPGRARVVAGLVLRRGAPGRRAEQLLRRAPDPVRSWHARPAGPC